MKKTKIIATIGPKSLDPIVLKNMLLNGADIIRINFSHCSMSFLHNAFTLIKRMREELNLPVAIMVDTRGPEVRILEFKDKKVILKAGDTFSLDSSTELGNKDRVGITVGQVLKGLKVDSTIFVCDGQIELKVKSTSKDKAECLVVKGGAISNNKSLYFKDAKLNLKYIDEIDDQFLKFSLQNKCDIISASFVSSKDDIAKIKVLCKQKNHNPIIISKIENREGLDNINEILQASDGIMVARGDLGVEVSYAQIPKIQNDLIQKAREYNKISIVATEMLESMINANRPTRAETSDIALAISQGASAIMLSAETAVGVNPALCVSVMNTIAQESEKNIPVDYVSNLLTPTKDTNVVLSQCSTMASHKMNAKAIAVYTNSGKSAITLSLCYPSVPVVAITDDKSVYYKLAMYYAIVPYFAKFDSGKDINIQSCEIVKQLKIAKKNDKIITLTGTTDKISNLMKVNIIK